MDLSKKTLLMLGGGAYAKDVCQYKKESGFRVVTVGEKEDPRTSIFSDKHYFSSRTDIDELSKIVDIEKVDGIFVGSSEEYASVAITLSEKTNAHFYATRKQWDILQNKARFKQYARESGFPVIPEFTLSNPQDMRELESLSYPIMIKPTDSSGAKGVNACYKAEDFQHFYEEALKWSHKKEVIVEKLITDAVDFCVSYTIQNSEATLSYAYTKFKVTSPDHFVSIPMFHMFPSRYIDEYCEKVDKSAKQFIKNLGIENGGLILQGFYKNGEFAFYEAGYRLGGGQVYILTDYQNKANLLKYIINQVLVGKMADYRVAERENARFQSPCCNYYMPLKAGVIKKICGLEQVKQMKGVLNVTQMRGEGDRIVDTNALDRVVFRIHAVAPTNEELAALLENISNTIRVYSEDDEEMQMEPLTYSHCLDIINKM